jgi:hypothetical protein
VRTDHTGPRGYWGRAVVAALALMLMPACSSDGKSDGPTGPSNPAPASVSGTWSGSATDSSGGGAMSWQLTQADTSISGTATITDTGTGVTGRGSISGTLSGSSLRFSIAIPARGFDSPFESCSATVSGDAQASASTLTGTYTGSNSCAGSIASGSFTLNKQ